MLKKISVIILLLACFSCKKNTSDNTIDLSRKNIIVDENNYSIKLIDSLLLLKNDTIISLDLSKKKLTEFPDLSRFYIQNLDLSENSIDSITESYLPKNGLQRLNISKNNLKSFSLAKKCYSNLVSLDLSNNYLSYVYIKCAGSRLDISNNNLEKLHLIKFKNKRINYLNVSNNINFSNVVEFNIKLIDTIIHKNISNNKDLISSWSLIKLKPIE